MEILILLGFLFFMLRFAGGFGSGVFKMFSVIFVRLGITYFKVILIIVVILAVLSMLGL